MRIAMWSGPRNLSTAMMYSFGQRADMHCVDEPFYGPYLRLKGLAHPMRDAILQSRPEDAFAVEQSLLQPPPGAKAHSYHKHMCQHMVPGIPRTFMGDCVNVFLLRHPARVAASFLKGYADTTADDLGFRLQAELFDQLKAMGQSPVVVNSADIRADPQGALRGLCDRIGLPWDAAMLRWPSGPKPYDGVWAAHWYRSVHASTGFAGPEGPMPALSDHGARLVEEVMPFYARMKAASLDLC